MKNKRQPFYILLASLLFVSAAICFLFAMKTLGSSDKGAPAKDDPVQIAAVEVKKRYSDTIDLYKYDIELKDDKENNRCIVAYCLKSKSGVMMLGGGGPEVVIDRKTGKIVSILLQK